MKKTIFGAMAAFLLLGMIFSAAYARVNLVMIPAGFVNGEHYNLVQGESLAVLGHMYMAKYPSLVRQFIKCVNFTVTLYDGQGSVVLQLSPDEVRALWTDPTPNALSVMENKTTFSQAYWQMPLPDLAAGDYEMHTVLEFTQALSRGCDLNGDGKVDVYLPEDYNKEYVVYVHVTGEAGSGNGLGCLVGRCLP